MGHLLPQQDFTSEHFWTTAERWIPQEGSGVLDMERLGDQDRLRKILEMVQAGSHSSIQGLATQFQLSASHLQHLFKAHTGLGLGRQMAEQRLYRASLLLLESDMSIKEIAYAVGYKHPSSFVRAFERRFGQAPSDYRQEMLTER